MFGLNGPTEALDEIGRHIFYNTHNGDELEIRFKIQNNGEILSSPFVACRFIEKIFDAQKHQNRDGLRSVLDAKYRIAVQL